MMTSPNASSWLPWIWAVETLASNHANSSVLIDLVKKIPDDVLENDGKNAKELACLRILEGLYVSRKGNCGGDSSKLDGNAVGFDSSECCENVVRQIVVKEPSRPNFEFSESEMLRWDVEKFVKDKRSCLPKCTLKQLKDAILKDSHLLPSSLKEKSGLLINSCSDGVTKKRTEGSNCDAPENPKAGELSSVKRVVDDLATPNEGVASTCRQMIVYSGYPSVNAASKRKRDAFCTQQVVEGNDSVSFHKSSYVKNVSGGIVQDSGREGSSLDKERDGSNLDKERDGSNLDREPWTKSFKGNMSSKNDDFDFVASKKLMMSSTIEANLLHNQIHATRNVGKMTQDRSSEEQSLNICAEKPKKYGEPFAVLKNLGGSRQAVIQGTKSFDAAKDKCKQSCSLIAPNSLCCGGIKTTMKNDHRREIISYDDTYHDENDDIIVREDALLTTQYSDSEDSFAEVNGTKQLCMICKIGGQLLFCTSGSCRRVVHERCLGVVPTFDAKRKFYCPFCAYSRAVSKYSDSKKQYSLAKKALLSFISRDEYRLRNSNISDRADWNHLREFEASVKCTEQNNLENVVSRGNQARCMMRKKEKPSVLCDPGCREGERVVTCGENMSDEHNAERSGRSMCFQSTRKQVQQVPELDVQNGKAYNSLHGGSKQLAVVEKLQEVLQQPNGVILVRNNEEQKIASQAVQDGEVHYSNCKYLKIDHGSKPHTETNREQDVCNQPNVLSYELAKPLLRSDVEGSSGEKDDTFIACYHSLRVQKQEQHCPYPSIPQLRRKKVPWSSAEEEALKEGVRRFASDHNRTMPWTKILEFGAEIFEKHRTAIDLKDKWRNICKGSRIV